MDMPRYNYGTALDDKQEKKLQEVVRKLKKTPYRILQEALEEYCDKVLKSDGKSESRGKDQADSEGRTDSSSKPSNQGISELEEYLRTV